MAEIEKVIDGNFCVGCGACSYYERDRFKVDYDDYGMLKASLVNSAICGHKKIDSICPFTSGGEHEDEISKRLFSGQAFHKNIGQYLALYTGHVSDPNVRSNGSSGGFGRWILAKLRELDEIDEVIQVKFSSNRNHMYEFSIFKNVEDILKGAKSAYYPVTLDYALDYIRNNQGRYAITSVPCFSKAIRRLSLYDELINERVKFVIGIVCGHLKSKSFAESFAWQMGIHPDDLNGLDFRDKIKGKKANEKGVIATDRKGVRVGPVSSKTLFGGNWGHNVFKYKACDYCDDVLAETADCAIGDAWLPGFMDDDKGNNVIIIRNKKIKEIVDRSVLNGELSMEEARPDQIVESQLGGIRHRTEGLSLRLHDDTKAGLWVPKKRMAPSANLPASRKRVYRARVTLRDASHYHFKVAKERNSLSYYISAMKPLVKNLDHRPLWRRVLSKLKREFLGLIESVR